MAAALSRRKPHPSPAVAVTGERVAALARERLRTLPSPHAVGPVGRARAVELLAAGHTDVAVAHALAIDRGTVRRWRSEPAVAAELARARREREAAAAEALDDARRILAEAAPRAAQALVDALEDADPRVNLAAAVALLDRVGLGKGAAAPAPSSLAPDSREELAARFRRMTDAQLEESIREREAEASRGRVVVYLPPEDPATG